MGRITKITEDERTLLSDYAQRSFRNQADRDYVAARLVWRARLVNVFLWLALQAVEKYLKGILLFRCEEIKSYDHNVAHALGAVRNLRGLGFRIPQHNTRFIEYLSEWGPNRYLDFPFHVVGTELWDLDWTVWHVRRFCQDFLLMPGDADRYDRAFAILDLRTARLADTTRPTDFRVARGGLEEILERGEPLMRTALVWHNPCYGRRSKKPPPPQIYSAFENPTHVMHPRILLPLLKRLVPLPKEIVEQLERMP
jgi:hypothetical protein